MVTPMRKYTKYMTVYIYRSAHEMRLFLHKHDLPNLCVVSYLLVNLISLKTVGRQRFTNYSSV